MLGHCTPLPRRRLPTGRSKRHGAALVEALIAAAMIIVLFAGIWFFHSMYDARTTALRAARFQAWSATRPGCSGTITREVRDTIIIPQPALFGQRGEGRMDLRGNAAMYCNEEPIPEDDLVAAVQKFLDTGADILGGVTNIADGLF
ncbi:MAG: pilus assembly protein [Myxococcales bacterium]|nr:pilus assembly protein [Myxococcales bacterium]